MTEDARAGSPEEVLLALGSNLGDRRGNLESAIAGLAGIVAVDQRATVVETAPMYVADQAPFLNMCLTGTTGLMPEALLVALKRLERSVGRVPGPVNGPRLIDIDIIFYGQRRLVLDHLVIPHPRLAERGFVLQPAEEIAPDWVHPESGLSIAQMAADLRGASSDHEPALEAPVK